ncbi:MAG: hypothetical protein AB7U35_07550 [Sphingobium sp.]
MALDLPLRDRISAFTRIASGRNLARVLQAKSAFARRRRDLPRRVVIDPRVIFNAAPLGTA